MNHGKIPFFQDLGDFFSKIWEFGQKDSKILEKRDSDDAIQSVGSESTRRRTFKGVQVAKARMGKLTLRKRGTAVNKVWDVLRTNGLQFWDARVRFSGGEVAPSQSGRFEISPYYDLPTMAGG